MRYKATTVATITGMTIVIYQNFIFIFQ